MFTLLIPPIYIFCAPRYNIFFKKSTTKQEHFERKQKELRMKNSKRRRRGWEKNVCFLKIAFYVSLYRLYILVYTCIGTYR